MEDLRAGELELVTAIEILSPVNKRRRHEARAKYLHKRRAFLRSAAHLIEIDLLRPGLRPPRFPPPLYITLSREERRPCVNVWPIQLADTLPTIPVPLAAPDPDVLLDLSTGYSVRFDMPTSPPTMNLPHRNLDIYPDMVEDKGIGTDSAQRACELGSPDAA